jgi:hypothetical protein
MSRSARRYTIISPNWLMPRGSMPYHVDVGAAPRLGLPGVGDDGAALAGHVERPDRHRSRSLTAEEQERLPAACTSASHFEMFSTRLQRAMHVERALLVVRILDASCAFFRPSGVRIAPGVSSPPAVFVQLLVQMDRELSAPADGNVCPWKRIDRREQQLVIVRQLLPVFLRPLV